MSNQIPSIDEDYETLLRDAQEWEAEHGDPVEALVAFFASLGIDDDVWARMLENPYG